MQKKGGIYYDDCNWRSIIGKKVRKCCMFLAVTAMLKAIKEMSQQLSDSSFLSIHWINILYESTNQHYTQYHRIK